MDGITNTYVVMFFFGILFLTLFGLLSIKNIKNVYFYPKPKKFPLVSFLVPAYNEESSIENTTRAILAINYPSNKKEIILINDGSKDNTLRIMKKLQKSFSQIRILDKKNSGKANSLNEAIAIAKGELIAVVDADSCPAKESLNRIVGFFEENEKVAAVTSRVLVKKDKKLIERFQDLDYVIIAWDRKILDFIDCVYVTNGPLSVYRKNIVKKVGGFDPKNLTEDIEITWNLLSRGYQTRMSYSAEVYTGIPDNFNQWNKQRVRWNLGGLQTIWKYRKFFFTGKNLFGYFVLQYIAFSFFLALVGIILLGRYFFINLRDVALSIPFYRQGFNPFSAMEFNFSITIITIFGIIFVLLALVYYKFALKQSNIKNRGLISILTYIFIYRMLYIIPLVLSCYKLIKGDIRWYTK